MGDQRCSVFSQREEVEVEVEVTLFAMTCRHVTEFRSSYTPPRDIVRELSDTALLKMLVFVCCLFVCFCFCFVWLAWFWAFELVLQVQVLRKKRLNCKRKIEE